MQGLKPNTKKINGIAKIILKTNQKRIREVFNSKGDGVQEEKHINIQIDVFS